MKLRQFSKRDKERINEASLDLLATVGVEVPHEETLDRFAAHGARVDKAKQRVRIPAELVQKCLGTAGKKLDRLRAGPEEDGAVRAEQAQLQLDSGRGAVAGRGHDGAAVRDAGGRGDGDAARRRAVDA